MAGLVPAIPIRKARRSSDRDHRDKPGDDSEEGAPAFPALRATSARITLVLQRHGERPCS
jgi:hypothetical protein